MYAKCPACGKQSRYLVDTEHGTTETRCDEHAENDDVVRTVNHKRNTMPFSEGGSGTSFRAACSSCGDEAVAIIRFEDGLGVITTEARCANHIIDDYQTKHDIGTVDIAAEDVTL